MLEEQDKPKRKNDYFGLLFLGIIAFFVGHSLSAWAKPNVQRTNHAPKLAVKSRQLNAQSYLSGGVWRTSECGKQQGFQAFFFANPAKVEVGNGKIGEGERLEILSTTRTPNIVEVRTRVCAPIGCNQTFEQYKIINQNQMQEWRFEGLLPNEPPNVVVKEGIATDGSLGRVFNRCST